LSRAWQICACAWRAPRRCMTPRSHARRPAARCRVPCATRTSRPRCACTREQDGAMLGLGEQGRLLVAGAWAHTGGDGACRLCPQLAWPARPRPYAIGHAQAGRAWSLALRAVGGRGPYSRGAERSEHHTGGRRESTRTSNAQREVREAARVPEGAKNVFITTAHATRESEALEDQMSNVRLSVR
jgi:hypothetical protein